MPGVSRVNQDTAGGLIVGNLAPTVWAEAKNVAVQGAAVASHPPIPPHVGTPVMVGCSSTVFANGIGVCREGDAASCGHTASGSTTVFVGG